ncbi:MAG: hypothetical protein J0M12_13080 [Deltaproteobacteria bacterium]|nr:hypothetical protein [Deltaproteobacteria bacterium]
MKTYYVALLSGAVMSLHAGAAFARDGDQISRGTISAITANRVTVGSLSCPTNGGTEYEDLQGNPIPRSRFNVGDVVKLVCRGSSAHSLEMENDNGGGSNSNGGGGNGGSTDVKLKDRFAPPDGVTTGAVGKVDYRNKPNGAGRDDRLTITVKVPVPSEVPAAATFAEARALDLSAVLSRDGTPYARCTLGYDHRTAVRSVVAAEHKIDLRYEMKNSKLKLKSSKGRCDTNLALDGVQSGFPSVEAGDTIVIEDSLAGDILEGTL